MKQTFLFSIILLAFIGLTKTTNAQKVTDEGYQPVILQASFFYPLGTNGKDINVVNYTSFNLIYGKAAALEGFELSGIASKLNDYGEGVQIAGLANGVENYFKGVQLAGFGNAVGSDMEGVQISGFGSVAGSSARGVQISGFGSVSGDNMEGLQIAGFGNVVGESIGGLQLAGFANIAGENMEGLQIAGFSNICGEKGDGAQIAGFMNINNSFSGFQLAAFNINGDAKGFQLGVVNIAKNYEGVPIGVVTWVKNGYRKIDVWANESFYMNAAFKTGISSFYNILALSYDPGSNYSRYGLGWGLGSEIPLGKKAFMNIEALATQVGENEIWTNKLNLLNQLKFNFGGKVAPKLGIYAGPSLSVMVSEYVNPDGKIGSEIAPDWDFYNKTSSGGTNVKIWAGLNIGIRIL